MCVIFNNEKLSFLEGKAEVPLGFVLGLLLVSLYAQQQFFKQVSTQYMFIFKCQMSDLQGSTCEYNMHKNVLISLYSHTKKNVSST